MARKRRRRRTPAKQATVEEPKGRSKKGSRALARLTDRFEELRFEPEASMRELVAVILLSFGALSLGAGIYAQWFWRAAEAPAYAPALLLAGVAMLLGYGYYAPRAVSAVIVGQLGVGVEQDGQVRRWAWCEVQQLTLVHGALLLETAGKPLQIIVKEHPAAARCIVDEGLARIPKRVAITEDDASAVGARAGTEGELRTAEAPQVTERHCRATDRLLNIERDVRMCVRCGALYHQKGVPRRCLECRRILRLT